MYATTQPQAATSVLAVQSCTVCHSYMYTDCSIGLILLCAHTHLAMSLGMHPVLKTARDATGTNNSVSVTDSTFINNTAITEGGGAIYSNGQYANITLTSSTFHNNSASYCSVLDVDNYNHFSVNLTNSIFTYNTASGQTIGGGVACIRNATINIIDSTFKHNFANHHAGVFYIDESQTTVDGSLFINNSAALDGGVFYTYVHASDYIIRRSQFSENMAGDDGGVMLIGRLNCYVSIDETIFDFNSAGDRGGVVAIIASSMFMEINRTNIFNNFTTMTQKQMSTTESLDEYMNQFTTRYQSTTMETTTEEKVVVMVIKS